MKSCRLNDIIIYKVKTALKEMIGQISFNACLSQIFKIWISFSK